LGLAPAMAIDCAGGGDGAFSCRFLLKQSPMVADRWIRELVEMENGRLELGRVELVYKQSFGGGDRRI
jgi:hypothetical protein